MIDQMDAGEGGDIASATVWGIALSGEKYEGAQGYFETSSSIKSPIGYFALMKAISDGKDPEEFMLTADHDRHMSNGSGVLRHELPQERRMRLSLDALLELNIVESDCVATNVLIEYVGGQEAVNQQFANLGIENIELVTERLYFSGVDHYAVPFQVGKAKPSGLVQYYEHLLEARRRKPSIIEPYLSVHTRRRVAQLFGLYSSDLPPCLQWTRKGGSMFDWTPRYGEYIALVDAGILELDGKTTVIAFMSTRLDKGATTCDERGFCKEVAFRNVEAMERYGVIQRGLVLPFKGTFTEDLASV